HPFFSARLSRVERFALDQPVNPPAELLALESRRMNLESEALAEMARDHPFDPADLADVSDNRIADVPLREADDPEAGRRHVDRPAGIFEAVKQHAAAGERDFEALVTT